MKYQLTIFAKYIMTQSTKQLRMEFMKTHRKWLILDLISLKLSLLLMMEALIELCSNCSNIHHSVMHSWSVKKQLLT